MKTAHILKLDEPIELVSPKTGEVVSTITEITLRKPNLGDLVAAIDGGMAAQGTMVLNLAAGMSGMSKQDLAKLSLVDGMRLMEAVQGFMPAGLLTGSGGLALSLGNSASPQTGDAGGQPNSPSGLRVQLSAEAATEA